MRPAPPPRACALGSVKSMIGHTKCTAGVAGLVKASLALHHKVLPPTIDVGRPNPRIGFEDGPFHVNTETRPWVHAAAHSRRAGVSAFGFGGTNFHCVVEEYRGGYRDDDAPCPRPDWTAEPVVLSAADDGGLRALAQRVAGAVRAGAAPELRDLAAALWREVRDEHPARLAVAATDLADLAAKLEAAAAQLDGPGAACDLAGVHHRRRPQGRDGSVALLFPGQGSQRCDMLRDLAVALPDVRATFDRCDAVLAADMPQPLSRFVFPPPAFDDEERTRAEAALRDTAIAQPALGACGMAAAGLLDRLGLCAAMAGGHSYGELVALWAAGALDAADLLRLSAARGSAMAEAAAGNPGSMAAVAADAERVAASLPQDGGVVIANRNSPRQTVISGPSAAVEAAIERLASSGLSVVRLPVACAFHSPAMAGARERFAAAVRDAGLRAPDMPVYSNATAAPHRAEGPAIADALADHLVRPVRFREEIEAMYAAGARVFVEAGPRGVLTRLVGEILGDRPHAAVALQPDGRDGVAGLADALCRLASERVALDLAPLWAGRAGTAGLDELLSPRAAPQIPAGAWLVDGGSARPAGTPPPRPGPARAHPAAASTPLAPAAGPPSGSGAPLSPRDSGAPLPPRDAAMTRFLGLMDTFLADQRDVMLTLLGNEPGRRSAPPAPAPMPPPPPRRPASCPSCATPVAPRGPPSSGPGTSSWWPETGTEPPARWPIGSPGTACARSTPAATPPPGRRTRSSTCGPSTRWAMSSPTTSAAAVRAWAASSRGSWTSVATPVRGCARWWPPPRWAARSASRRAVPSTRSTGRWPVWSRPSARSGPASRRRSSTSRPARRRTPWPTASSPSCWRTTGEPRSAARPGGGSRSTSPPLRP